MSDALVKFDFDGLSEMDGSEKHFKTVMAIRTEDFVADPHRDVCFVEGRAIFVNDDIQHKVAGRYEGPICYIGQVIFPSENSYTATFTATFEIESLEYAGYYNGEMTWDISLRALPVVGKVLDGD